MDPEVDMARIVPDPADIFNKELADLCAKHGVDLLCLCAREGGALRYVSVAGPGTDALIAERLIQVLYLALLKEPKHEAAAPSKPQPAKTKPPVQQPYGWEAQPMSCSGWVHLENCRVIKVTEKAILIDYQDGDPIWLPKSQVSEAEQYAAGDADVTISISEWIAKQKDLP